MDDDAVALRLGRLVIASARLELEVAHLAKFLGGTTGNAPSQLQQFRAIRRAVNDRTDGDEIRTWVNEANDLLKARGELVHGGFLGRWKGNAMVAAYISHKRGEVVDIDLDRLDDLVDAAVRLASEGRVFSSRIFGEFVEQLGGEYRRD